jgi:hypothetical protein
MIVDYNYRPQAQYIGNTAASFTITAKGNKGFIYIRGTDDIGDVYPLVNFYSADGSLTGITLGNPSGSILDLYLAQFKIDTASDSRLADINFPGLVGGAGSETDSIFLPIKFHSMIFNVDVSGTGDYTEKPLLITLY